MAFDTVQAASKEISLIHEFPSKDQREPSEGRLADDDLDEGELDPAEASNAVISVQDEAE